MPQNWVEESPPGASAALPAGAGLAQAFKDIPSIAAANHRRAICGPGRGAVGSLPTLRGDANTVKA